MEEAPVDGKESSHSAHANGMNYYFRFCTVTLVFGVYTQTVKTKGVHSVVQPCKLLV